MYAVPRALSDVIIVDHRAVLRVNLDASVKTVSITTIRSDRIFSPFSTCEIKLRSELAVLVNLTENDRFAADAQTFS